MWGIIPAAGKRSRIQPLAFSKELLPVGSRLDGKDVYSANVGSPGQRMYQSSEGRPSSISPSADPLTVKARSFVSAEK